MSTSLRVGVRRTSLTTMLLFVASLTNSVRASGLRLSISPRGTQIKTVGSGIIFTCVVVVDDSADLPQQQQLPDSAEMRWVGPDLQYVSSAKGSRVYAERFDALGTRLYITKIRDGDDGIYTCKARIADTGEMLEQETKMFLYEGIKFADTPTELRYSIGSSALLECIATGQPMPVVSWRFNRRKITPDGDKYNLEERGLRIDKLDLRDNGTYECRAEVSSHGNLKVRTITVDVQYPPVIRREPTASLVVKGRSTELSCEADGNPPITYEWFKEKQMSESIRVRMKLHNVGGSYFIRSVDSDDEGRYICRVSNSLGSKELPVNVTVLEMPVIEEQDTKVILEGRTCEIVCSASGRPLPDLSWRRVINSDDYVTGIQPDDNRILVDPTQPGSSRLIIQAVNRSDAGLYTCSAVNAAGTAASNVLLVVQYLPSVELSSGDKDLVGWSGELRNVTCVGRGLPLPTVQWLYRGGQQVTDNSAFTVVTSRSNVTVTSHLQVRLGEWQPALYGNYTCLAKNQHGYTSKDVRLREAYLPDTPSNVSVLEEAATWVRLSAEAPRRDGGVPVSHWSVKYELADSVRGHSSSRLFTNGKNMTVNGLSPGVSYTFYLAAGNAVGIGTAVKFRVRTPRRVSHNQQSDVPRRDSMLPGNATLYSDVSSNKNLPGDAVRGVVEPSHVQRGDGSDDGGQSFGVVFLGATVGVATVLAALLVAVVVCFVTAGRRRRRKRLAKRADDPADAGRPLPLPPLNGHVEAGAFERRAPNNHYVSTSSLQVRATTPQQPMPPTRKDSRSSSVQVSAAASPKPYRTGAAVAGAECSCATLPARTCPPATCSSTFHTMMNPATAAGVDDARYLAQRRAAWDAILQRQGDAGPAGAMLLPAPVHDIPDAAERPISMSELPPPPDFLLENAGPELQLSGVAMKTSDRLFDGRTASSLLFEVADGYRSADSVDDDIDVVDYTIRQPSVHGHLQYA